jgi:anaerobic selenocysteine-containing dehydrogenase
VILIHPDDLTRLGLSHEQLVDVVGPAGRLLGVHARSYDRIKPGNALMYFPEANALVPRDVDPRSRTPVFKGIVVSVQPSSTATANARTPDSTSARSTNKLHAC